MKIDKTLNLVIPVECDDGSKLFVHTTPVSSDIFDTYWEPVAKTFANIFSGGYSVVAGPRIAAKMLRKVSGEMGVWEGKTGVRMGLVAEIYRRTLVLCPSEKGWEQIPYEEAKKSKLDPVDAAEIEGALVFFTVASLTNPRKDLEKLLAGMSEIWGSLTTSSNSTEYMNSLETSTGTDNSGETAEG